MTDLHALPPAPQEAAPAVTATDHLLPQFHVRLPRGYVNDPNGPIDIGGQAHLYFQSRPRVDLEIPVEWGHATSDDLVHWTLHRPAIVPVPGGADSGGAWSGNTVLHNGTVRAYYSGKVDHSPFQSVLLAESTDGGITFGPPVQVVADPSADEAITMFRDPFVWQTDDGWSMAVGAAARNHTASVRHYRSVDGISWSHAGDLVSMARDTVNGIDTGEGWECPQILTVDGIDIAIVASWSHAAGPGEVVAIPLAVSPSPFKVDEGQHFYAASVMRTSSWGPVLFGWVTEGRTEQWTEQAGWSGAISLPRRAWITNGRLGTEPHPAIDALRVGSSQAANGARIGAQAEIVLPVAITGCIRLRFSDAEYLDITVDVDADTLTVDRAHASTDYRADPSPAVIRAPFDRTADRPAVRVLLDGSVLELFTSAGRSVTTRVYPTQAPPWSVEAPNQALAWHLKPSVTTVSAPAADATAGSASI
ncbi:beta-fructofuranosidase [Curtobacterium sp. PhB142]|uniref:glycoside hydrolase family 32 protein n=1 Tax=unclassified Curtobacterium TaxID=257496 RepID=UPI00104EC564|nr:MULTISPECIES: glycoside hydrolase family 32 protein [unclassified Curtobacterium]TDW63506.1 beta-fructofuranosidase [Curtobacterium sp. PhB25]TCL80489.1 beta-fructofuranosidase [Curtobacterium sp. PhB142]TCL99729.1 beta-fructofuranosidase [Curtobacterium sp. PhB134]TCU43894.1 beta-fructofuranosidase [Curtobacterium sp. PhB146]TDW43208.1 beta-fructofuranosidase [Curtobacterium sp. PhB42]